MEALLVPGKLRSCENCGGLTVAPYMVAGYNECRSCYEARVARETRDDFQDVLALNDPAREWVSRPRQHDYD